MPKAARKTKSAKPQPKPKAEKVKRKALRNIDNEEVKSKKVNRVTKSKKNSQEQVVEKKKKQQPRRSARGQKTNYEEEVDLDLSIESCLKEAQIDLQVSSTVENLNVSSLNPASASGSSSPDRAMESKVSKPNVSKPNKNVKVNLARPLDLEYVEMRDWRSSTAMDY